MGLDALPWAVVALIPTDVAYASLAKMRRIVIFAIAAALGAWCLSSFDPVAGPPPEAPEPF